MIKMSVVSVVVSRNVHTISMSQPHTTVSAEHLEPDLLSAPNMETEDFPVLTLHLPVAGSVDLCDEIS
jgi:hypothetical protein